MVFDPHDDLIIRTRETTAYHRHRHHQMVDLVTERAAQKSWLACLFWDSGVTFEAYLE
jgi:hypothetical protein